MAPFYGGVAGVAARIQRATDAMERYLRDGEPVTVPADEVGDRAGMFFELGYYGSPIGEPSRGGPTRWPR